MGRARAGKRLFPGRQRAVSGSGLADFDFRGIWTLAMSFSTRLLPLFLSISIGAAAAACSGGDASAPESLAPVEPNPTEPPVEAVPAESEVTPSATLPLREKIDPAIVSALKTANIDVEKLPATLDDVVADPTKLKAVMKTFTIALGTTCDGCHQKVGTKINYETETPKKNVAKKMWSELVRKLQKKEGGAIYCDSCHQGKMNFLDRADDRALGTWMKDNFVNKLSRVDGKTHGCPTCHGETFDGDLLSKWAK